ncbi:MAG: hypothetical protein K2N73_02290 [Lachnospiraceae bacterium]|nr:hypothetical protein [Lachnospiraceae bacterium]
MGARQFAICDNDGDYLKMLQAYLLKRNPVDFEILTFDTVEKAQRASEEKAFEILLVGEKIYDENVAKINAAKVYILQEDGLAGITAYSVVAKYQSMERLITQILDAFAQDINCGGTGRCGKNRTSLISCYSPERHSGQSVATLAMAQALADIGNKVLYLNLMPFTGFEEILRAEYEADVTDFMYFVLNHSDKLPYKLDGLKRCIHGVDYLPPALDFADLQHISEEDWGRVLDLLLYSSDYTYIVMDLSETCQGFYRILEQSDRIYTLTDKSSVYSRAMLSHYKKLLEKKERTAILDRLTEFELPQQWKEHSTRFENIVATPVGACMKGVLGIDE